MAKALKRRLRKLEKIFETEKPCQCSPVAEDPIDWSLATMDELREFIKISKASELAVPRTCRRLRTQDNHCGPVTADQGSTGGTPSDFGGGERRGKWQ